MIDINIIRENKEQVAAALLKKGAKPDLDAIIKLDSESRKLSQEVETLRARRNSVSEEIPKLKKSGADVSALLEEMKVGNANIKGLEDRLGLVKSELERELLSLPNIPDDDVVAGGKEANVVIKTVGKKPEFVFTPKSHFELAESLGLVDFERGVKLGGSGFWIYQGHGALLEWALLSFFISEHAKAGFQFIMPPHLLTWECGVAAGQFPKFEEDVFVIDRKGDEKAPYRFLLPTAETALVNIYRDEILKEAELPKRFAAYTPCYRSEAGGYRATERGTVRGHQFNKVELFIYATPEQSDNCFAELMNRAESIVQALGLHYQVSKLAAGDCSASMAKTFDIEVWIPSTNEYKEISSASNAREYQARRGNIRFKGTEGGKTRHVHTLNASGLATSRLVPAMLEQFQQADGSVVVPEVLRAFLGTDRLVVQGK